MSCLAIHLGASTVGRQLYESDDHDPHTEDAHGCTLLFIKGDITCAGSFPVQ